MPSAFALVYVGEPRHSLSVSSVLQQQFEGDLHLVAVAPENATELFADEWIDGVICGGGLDNAALQTVLDGADDVDLSVPVFDLTDAVAAVPSSVDVHHYPTTDPVRVANEMLDALGATTKSTQTEDTESAQTEESDDQETERDEETDSDSVDATPTRTLGLDPTISTDENLQVRGWDSRLDDRLALDAEEVQGTQLCTAIPVLDCEEVRDLSEHVLETDKAETTELQVTDDEWLELRAVPDDDGLLWLIRDISESKRHEQELEDARRRLDNTLDRITDAFFVLDSDDTFVLLNSRAEFVLDVEAEEVLGERFWDVFPAAVSTTFYHEFDKAIETQEPTSFEEYYQPLNSWFEVNTYPSEDGLSVFLRDVTDRVLLQQKLEELHETTQKLIVAESDTEIAEEAIESAVEVLDFPLTICWRFDETRQELRPLAWSEDVDERVDEVQSIEPDSGIAWDAYADNELRVMDSVALVTPHSHHPGDVNSELLVPLGEYGLLGTYSMEKNAFDETDTELFRILSTSVESAMARALRERQLAQRNERLNDFASTVSHDLRNPLHIASARTELAQDTGDVEHLEKVSGALERMETLIEDLLERARGQQDLERETVSLADAVEDAWDGVDTKDASLEVVDDAVFSADPTRLKQLFENLYRNAVEHAGEDVTVTVGAHDNGFYLADDGPGIPTDRREKVFEQGVTESEDGTGYGLAIVSEIVDGHGWTVEVTESQEGGARFEILHIHSMEEPEVA